MKKNIKFLFIGSIIIMSTLAFMSANNFGLSIANIGQNEAKEIPLEKVNTEVKEKVVAPIRASFEKADPHMFMMKCYSGIEYELHGWNGAKADSLFKFYDNQPIQGSLTFINCSKREPLGLFQLDLKKDEVMVKEGFLKAWRPLDEFLKEIEATDIH